MKNKVLVLDGNQRSALAATRSLGRKGIPVVVADERVPNLSSCSKYCVDSFAYPSPYEHPEEFVGVVGEECRKRGVEILFPMTEISTQLVIERKSSFAPVKIPFADYNAFDELTNKWKLLKKAECLGVPAPKTWFIDPELDLNQLKQELKFPLVLKPYRSRIFHNGKWVPASVKYADSWDNLLRLREEFPFRTHRFLVQEKVNGTGQGVFTLYNEGKPFVFFAHKRIREKPPTGGVSVLRESVPVDPVLKSLSEKLLNDVRWHGVAMVEFKVAENGKPYLMEVNARFWGSLQLAIDSGIDFPFLLYQMACGRSSPLIKQHRLYIRTRWLLGDLDHLYLSLFKKGTDLDVVGKIMCLLDFLNFFDRRTHLEVLRPRDLKPFIFELGEYIGIE